MSWSFFALVSFAVLLVGSVAPVISEAAAATGSDLVDSSAAESAGRRGEVGKMGGFLRRCQSHRITIKTTASRTP